MSLINDALKRAQEAQPPPPNPESLHLRPAEPEQYARHGLGLMLPGGLALLALLILFFVWRLVQTPGNAVVVHAKSQTLTSDTSPLTSTPAPSLASTPQPVTDNPPNGSPVPPKASGATNTPNASPTTTNLTLMETNHAATNSTALPETAAKPTPLKLQGIVFNPRRPSALINGRPLFVGDRIGEFRVLAIDQESATLVGAGQTNVLTLDQ